MTTKQGFWARLKSAGQLLFSGYDAISNSRFRKTRGFQTIRPEEEELNPYDRDKLVAELMHMKRNNPIIKSIARLKKTDVVGAGILPQPDTNNIDFNQQLIDLWGEWSDDPEVTGQFNMAQVQQELASTPLIFGDCGVLLTKEGQLQLIDGSRIGDPQAASLGTYATNPDKNGVIVNAVGRPTAYRIGSRVNGQLRDIQTVPASDFLLYFMRMRPEQWRGIPRLAPCVDAIQDIQEYEQIEMVAAKVSASLSAVVKRSNAVQFEIADRQDPGEQDAMGRLEQFEPGSVYYLEPGEDVTTIASNGRPNVNAIEWLTFRLRQIGAAIGIPYEFLMQDIGKSSFSAAQGVVLQYQSAIEDEQRSLIQFCDKIYRWKLNGWVAAGTLKIPNDVPVPYRVRWQPPRFRWINRASQVDSDIRYLQLGAMSLDDVASQFGDSAQNIMRQKARNIVDAKEIAEQYDIDDYRELFNQMETFANANFVDLLNMAKQPQTPDTTNEEDRT